MNENEEKLAEAVERLRKRNQKERERRLAKALKSGNPAVRAAARAGYTNNNNKEFTK